MVMHWIQIHQQSLGPRFQIRLLLLLREIQLHHRQIHQILLWLDLRQQMIPHRRHQVQSIQVPWNYCHLFQSLPWLQIQIHQSQ